VPGRNVHAHARRRHRHRRGEQNVHALEQRLAFGECFGAQRLRPCIVERAGRSLLRHRGTQRRIHQRHAFRRGRELVQPLGDAAIEHVVPCRPGIACKRRGDLLHLRTAACQCERGFATA
jgi:hypothetical protein